MGKHFTANEDNHKGYFEKVNPIIRDYRVACLAGERGFLGEMHNAHHILPATAFKKSIALLTEEKQTYARNCQHVTPWNINNDQNLIGLPHLRSFILSGQGDAELKADEPEYIKARTKSFASKTSIADRTAMLAKLRRSPPEGYPVHLPVSWGHTLYNHGVKNDLGAQVWDALDENKAEHKIDPETIEAALKKLEKKYYNHLKNRGAGATLDNWRLRSSTKNWDKSFTMYPGADPLG